MVKTASATEASDGNGERPALSLELLAGNALLSRHVETLDFWVDPAVAFGTVVDATQNAFWLDGGVGAVSGWSHLGDLGPLGVVARCDAAAKTVSVTGAGWPGQPAEHYTFRASVFDLIAATIPKGTTAETDRAAEFELGWVGWLDYESGAVELGIPHAHSGNEVGTRDISTLLFADRAISFDHERRQLRLTALVAPNSSEHLDWCADTAARLRSLAGIQAAEPAEAPAPALGEVRMRHSTEQYRGLIAASLAEIAAGNAYQLCLTNRFEVETHEDPVAIYRRLRLVNPTTHGALLIAGPVALLSSSPELFLSVDAGRRVQTRPIKGTRPRGRTAAEDARLRDELRNDTKERAENVMIVDLMRNDLSKVSATGTVEVTRLFDVAEYANVFQLVSTVTSQLAPETTVSDLLGSTFPAGSMTGAPKISAMGILNSLEGGPRGAYAGAFGYISLGGTVELAMTIRTIVLANGTASFGSGGGITASSNIESELAETFVKIAPLLAALGVRRDRHWS